MEGLSKFQSPQPERENGLQEQDNAPPVKNDMPKAPNPMIAVLENHERISNRLKQNGAK